MSWDEYELSRRALLKAMIAAGMIPYAAGCGGSDDKTSERKKGGRMRTALLGAANETLNPNLVEFSAADLTRFSAIFDQLAVLIGGKATLVLAESIEPNADATRWTVKLRDGVTFHDGKPLTSADAVWSLRRTTTDPKSTYREDWSDIKAKDIKVVDKLTFEVPLSRPRGDFVEGVLAKYVGSSVYQENTKDFKKPVGTGPFVLESYEPGKTAVLTANKDYFGGAPLLDELVVDSIIDPTARFNALRGGQLDFVKDLSFASARAAKKNPALQVIVGGAGDSNVRGVSMNIQLPPFDNPKVREAFKIAVDRQKILDTALAGFGEVGNDLIGKGLPGYNDDLPPREYDPDKARSLLKGAGAINVSIRAADTSPGVVDGVQVYIEQLKAIGVTARLSKESVDTYYGDLKKNNNTPIQGAGGGNQPVMSWIGSFSTSDALLNVQGWKRPKFDAQYREAQATADAGKREEILGDLQRQLYEDGGNIVWAIVSGPDGARKGVNGIQYANGTPLFHKASLG